MDYQINHFGILILAAGQSKRLGEPKQLLAYGGETLISKVTRIARSLGDYPVICVLGAYAEEIKSAIHQPELHLVWNEHWREGMASSITVGLKEMQRAYPGVDGVMILVCDQPFLDRHIMEELAESQRQSGLPAAAAAYQGRLGTPALFHASLFSELMQLNGDKGARLLLDSMRGQVCEVQFERGAVDIDAPEDYKRLLEQDK